MDLSILLFLSIALISSTLSTVVGFGSALILISASTLVFDIKWSIAVTAFFFSFNTVTKTVVFREHIDRPLTVKICILAVPGVAVGSFLLVHVDSTYIYLLLGSLSLLYLAMDFFGVSAKFKMTDPLIYLAGLTYGFISGIAGSGGIVKVIAFNQIQLSKERFVGTMAATALPMNAMKIAVFIYGGLVAWKDLPVIVGLLFVSLLGVQLGKRIMPYVSEVQFGRLLRLMLLVLSLRLLYMATTY